MREMSERPAEDFARCLDDHRCDQFSTELPPRASRLKLVIEEHVVRAQAFDGAFEADVVDEAPRLATKIAHHPKDIVKDLGDATHLKSARAHRKTTLDRWHAYK